MGCCFGSPAKSGSYDHFNSGSSARQRPETEEDRQARALAAERAAQRQQNFEQSAVGRAAIKSVKDAKKPVNNGPQAGMTAQDWQN